MVYWKSTALADDILIYYSELLSLITLLIKCYDEAI